MSPQTWQQVSDYFEAEAGAPIEVEGQGASLGALAHRGRAPRAPDGQPPAGGPRRRDAAVQHVDRRLPAKPRGRVIVVRGDPGIGKSRLAAEFLSFGARTRPGSATAPRSWTLARAPGTTRCAGWRKACSALPRMPTRPAASEAIAASPRARAARSTRPSSTICWTWPPPASVRALLSAIDVAVRRNSTRMPCARWPPTRLERAQAAARRGHPLGRRMDARAAGRAGRARGQTAVAADHDDALRWRPERRRMA